MGRKVLWELNGSRKPANATVWIVTRLGLTDSSTISSVTLEHFSMFQDVRYPICK